MADAKQIFDHVTEEEFNSISKKVALEDDFIVDDNGQGKPRKYDFFP